jgi:hypothetical protein
MITEAGTQVQKLSPLMVRVLEMKPVKSVLLMSYDGYVCLKIEVGDDAQQMKIRALGGSYHVETATGTSWTRSAVEVEDMIAAVAYGEE